MARWLALAATLVAAALLLSPVAAAPTTQILGNFQSEASTHAPALAAALEGLLRNGPFVLAEHPLHPDDVTGAMYEPITTLWMWPVYRLAGGGAAGFTLAWNTWHLIVLCGSALGAWIWARAWLGDRDPEGWGAAAATSVAAASLFLHFSPEVGRTEANNYPLYALHGGLLFRAAKVGGRAWIFAALSTVPVIWSGGYGTAFFAVVEPLVATWALRDSPHRRATILGLVGVAVTAVIAVAPLALALKAHPYVGLVTRDGGGGPSVGIGVLFGFSENMLRELPGYEVAPFVGWATLAAAGLSLVRGRSAIWPVGIALFLYWIAAGPAPTVGEGALWSPAALLGALPGPFGMLRGWSRIFAFTVPLFAVAAGGLAAGRPLVAALVAAAVLGEVGVRHREKSSWTLEEPAAVVALRESGQMPIPLPLDNLERTRRWLERPHLPDVWKVMPDHDLFKYFQDALPNEPELFRSRFNAPPVTYDPCALRADAVVLRSIGYSTLYVRSDALPSDGKGMAVRALKAVFGPPREEDVWALPQTVGEECSGAEGVERPQPIKLHTEGDDASRARTPSERAAIRAARRAERDRVQEERIKRKQQR